MQLFVNRASGQGRHPGAGASLRVTAAGLLALMAGMQPMSAQQPAQAKAPAEELLSAPAPKLTKSLELHSGAVDFSQPTGKLYVNPVKFYKGVDVPKASFVNSPRLGAVAQNGKIYLSLSDALAMALENNYDIAIARYNLDIADTDILRSKTGASILGVSDSLLTGTLGSASTTLTSGGGPGGTALSTSASGAGGLSLTTSGAGPTPAATDPTLAATLQYERATTLKTVTSSPVVKSNTGSYNFTYTQGFTPGAALTVAWNNAHTTTSNPYALFSPQVTSNFKATVNQHLLQGAGVWVNKRIQYQAINNRRHTDSSFRLQVLYTINQVENIYWALVAAYEDVQAKEQALTQSTKLAEDTRKQFEAGAVAPLDVVNADSSVAADKQALVNSQSALSYQQMILKQAISRNLADAQLETAPIIPTDRVTLEVVPEESQAIEDLVQEAFKNRPELEQASITLQTNDITLRGAKNGMLPVVDVYGFYSGSGVSGSASPTCSAPGGACTMPIAMGGYGSAVGDMFTGTAPDKGVGVSVSIPLRNRHAQSIYARSQLEYRQAQLRLAQLYSQVRMQVVNAQLALTNDRALVRSAEAAEKYSRQNLEAEKTKLSLGASTTTNVFLQQRSLATATYNLITARAAYARDRANLYQTLASTLRHYGINLSDAATGDLKEALAIPGLAAAMPASK